MMGPPPQADTKLLFAESKNRLIERIHGNINNCGSLVRQIVRGSKTNELLSHCFKNFTNQDHLIENTEANIERMSNIVKSMIEPIEPRSLD